MKDKGSSINGKEKATEYKSRPDNIIIVHPELARDEHVKLKLRTFRL